MPPQMQVKSLNRCQVLGKLEFFVLIIQDNYTALHVAVQAGKANVVETLLGYGAQVHIRGKIKIFKKIIIAD